MLSERNIISNLLSLTKNIEEFFSFYLEQVHMKVRAHIMNDIQINPGWISLACQLDYILR